MQDSEIMKNEGCSEANFEVIRNELYANEKGNQTLNGKYLFVKRCADVVLSFVALIVLFPFFLIMSIMISVAMKGNPFFLQKRPGKNGKIFTLVKFRTMTNKKDTNGNLLPDEQRLTKFGEFLRKFSVDELPEIVNIFAGHMSIVGPRPQLVRDLVFFSDDAMRRQRVRPGLTGYAQVNGRNNIPWDERFDLDLEYIDKISFKLDVKIFFLTILKVFKSEDISTEGMATSEDYGDYLLRIGKIDSEYYSKMQIRAKKLLSEKNYEI